MRAKRQATRRRTKMRRILATWGLDTEWILSEYSVNTERQFEEKYLCCKFVAYTVFAINLFAVVPEHLCILVLFWRGLD